MKIVLVTGCNGGIGTTICEYFKAGGYTVVGTDLQDSCEHVDLYIKQNLCNHTSHQNIIEHINTKYHQLDCIVNVAAVQICKPVWETTVEEWDAVYNCNVRSLFLFAKYGLDLLKQSKGNILSIASVHSVTTSDQIAAYGSSKAAVVGLTHNLAIELGKFSIRVNCISPGAIDTPMLRAGLRRGHAGGDECTDDDLVNNLGKQHLMGRVGKTKEIASMCIFLADNDKSGFTTGSNFILDGGASIKLSTE